MENILHVVSISGGKDSQAVAKLIRERFPNDRIIGLFCDTKFEHPLTYEHVKRIATLYNLELVTLNAGSVPEKVLKYKRFPSGTARFCTDQLKIQPSKKYLISMAKEGYKVIDYIGVRGDESTERSKRYKGMDDTLYMPHEVMPSTFPKYMGEKLGIRRCMPILDWSKDDVFEYLNGEHNPLYDLGFDRVGCFPCLAGGDKSKMKAFKLDEYGASQLNLIKSISRHIHKPIFNTKIAIKLAKEYKEEKECDGGNGCTYCSM